MKCVVQKTSLRKERDPENVRRTIRNIKNGQKVRSLLEAFYEKFIISLTSTIIYNVSMCRNKKNENLTILSFILIFMKIDVTRIFAAGNVVNTYCVLLRNPRDVKDH